MGLGLGNILGHKLDLASTTQLHEQGHTVGPDNHGRYFEYVKCKETSIKGSPMAHKYSASDLVSTNVFATGVKAFGVMITSAVAAGGFGWVQTKGKGLVNLRVTGTVSARSRLFHNETGKAAAQAVTGNDALAFIENVAAKSGTNVVAGKYYINPW